MSEAKMSNEFDGTWTDQDGKEITVTSRADILTVKYPARGPFTGVAANLGGDVIYVDFTDDRDYAGVLSVSSKQDPQAGHSILWSNQTARTRKEEAAARQPR